MVHSSQKRKKAKSRVGEPQVYYLHTTHFCVLNLLHADVEWQECKRQAEIVDIRFNWNSKVFCHFISQHEKCISIRIFLGMRFFFFGYGEKISYPKNQKQHT